MADMRFSVEEITRVAQAAADKSDDGKVSLSEFTSALSRVVHHEEARKFRQITGRNAHGQLVAKKVA